jgi:hypothetical protein
MKLPPLLIVTLLACLLGRSAPSSSTDDDFEDGDLLMLNVFSNNVSTTILDTILSGSLKYLNVLIQAEPQYLGLGPGQKIPYAPGRFLRAGEKEGPSGVRQQRNRETAAAQGPESAHGPRSEPRRSLLMMTTCPLTCAKASSSSCKQLGCAYCGTSCRVRRRERRGRNLLMTSIMTSTMAAWIEGAINLLLSPLCARKKGCSIYSKIIRVRYYENGTVVGEPLV